MGLRLRERVSDRRERDQEGSQRGEAVTCTLRSPTADGDSCLDQDDGPSGRDRALEARAWVRTGHVFRTMDRTRPDCNDTGQPPDQLEQHAIAQRKLYRT